MYQNVRLEKGLYHLSGQSFSQALEAMDPTSQYADTPLAKLDAYERQLKRFDIRISGPNCDRVEKFFTSTESAVLFPEFIRRAIRSGIDSSILSDISAVQTQCASSQYLGCLLEDSVAYDTAAVQGAELPVTEISEQETPLALKKYARSIHISYEAVRRQRLDVLAVMLRSVGVKLGNAIVKAAVTVLKNEAGSSTAAAGSALAYSDLAALCGKFESFNLNTVLASPAVLAEILTLDQMLEASSENPGEAMLPFGARLLKTAQLDDNTIIGLDKDFALEMVTGTDLIMETDKLIDSQTNTITVSVQTGFRTITREAVHVLTK
ncbi:MAG: phage major capsid protein [Ruminococcus sp.]|nr:phage major capsid protein [Ruminococcus sp.]